MVVAVESACPASIRRRNERQVSQSANTINECRDARTAVVPVMRNAPAFP